MACISGSSFSRQNRADGSLLSATERQQHWHKPWWVSVQLDEMNSHLNKIWIFTGTLLESFVLVQPAMDLKLHNSFHVNITSKELLFQLFYLHTLTFLCKSLEAGKGGVCYFSTLNRLNFFIYFGKYLIIFKKYHVIKPHRDCSWKNRSCCTFCFSFSWPLIRTTNHLPRN